MWGNHCVFDDTNFNGCVCFVRQEPVFTKQYYYISLKSPEVSLLGFRNICGYYHYLPQFGQDTVGNIEEGILSHYIVAKEANWALTPALRIQKFSYHLNIQHPASMRRHIRVMIWY